VDKVKASTYPVSTQIKGTILGVRTVQNRGRVQIPKVVRNKLQISDGDNVYWIEDLDGKICIAKAVELK
jgi:AbrB family looped-hinge helix DNA binding protein